MYPQDSTVYNVEKGKDTITNTTIYLIMIIHMIQLILKVPFPEIYMV